MVLHFAKAGDLPIELNIGSLTEMSAPSAAPAGDASSMDMQGMDMSGMDGMSSMPM